MPVIVAPTLPFGFVNHHVSLWGTVSISTSTYLDVLTDVAVSLVKGGFRSLVFVNGHGGNVAAVAQVPDRIVHELGLDVHVASTSYWDSRTTSSPGSTSMPLS